jgi:hypothetical protein
MSYVEDCDSHEYVWFRDDRDSTKQVGEFLVQSYFCQRCGLIQQVLYRSDEDV